jgi:hypothetical protein
MKAPALRRNQPAIFSGGENEMLFRWGFIQGFDADGSDPPDLDYLVSSRLLKNGFFRSS